MASYDVRAIEKTYINGDEAAWIKSGQKYLDGSKFVLDRYHMHKYILGATSHLQDLVGDARSKIHFATLSFL